MPASPEGGEPDAWVPLQGLGLISGNTGVQQYSEAGVQEWGVEGMAGWTTRDSERPFCCIRPGDAFHLALAGCGLRGRVEGEHCVSSKG